MKLEAQVFEELYAELAHDVKLLGVGSGRTVKRFLQMMPDGLKAQLTCVPTSHDTKLTLINSGFLTSELPCHDSLDATVDGFDAALGGGDDVVAIKGAGGCMTWEKLVALHSKRLYLIGEEGKTKKDIAEGAVATIPVEVLPMALALVQRHLKELCGTEGVLRQGSGKMGPVVTDFGNWIVDVRVPLPPRPVNLKELHAKLKALTGVVETGIFAQIPFNLRTYRHSC